MFSLLYFHDQASASLYEEFVLYLVNKDRINSAYTSIYLSLLKSALMTKYPAIQVIIVN